MPRPIKWRIIEQMPKVRHFTPAHGSSEFENVLKIEEFEAIRLKDLEGLEQEACAERMQVSRPTFQRILIDARKKVADSLVHGKDLRIEGGNYARQICPVICLSCGRKWDQRVENPEKIHHQELVCPSCGSEKIDCRRHKPGRSPGECFRFCRRFGRYHKS